MDRAQRGTGERAWENWAPWVLENRDWERAGRTRAGLGVLGGAGVGGWIRTGCIGWAGLGVLGGRTGRTGV